ncbi:MAG: hypothetical protein J0L53_04600 [Spirochaetes bacterium]|nr:hypothetical protein [Spirochaetota bacterium]
MKNLRLKTMTLVFAATLAGYCGKKKENEAPKAQAKIAYAVYGTGLYDQIGASKASEYLNRGEMVTVLEIVTPPSVKEDAKSKSWAKIERTTGKQGFFDASHLESKAFVVIRPLDVFSINQASGKKLATVPAGQVGFIVEEKADWAKIRFGSNINEGWGFAKENSKWVDQKWAQVEGVSYDAAAIGQGVELETALRKYATSDAAKKAAGKKELEAIVKEGKSQFIEVAQKALAAENETKSEETKPADAPGGN